MFIRNIALITLLALGSATGIAQVKEIVPDKFEMRMRDYIKKHPEFPSELAKVNEEQQRNYILEPKVPSDPLKSYKYKIDYKDLQKEKKVGIYITEKIVMDLKSPEHRYFYNSILLAMNKDLRKFDVIDGANKILSADPKADPNKIKEFMLLVSDAAVAEGDKPITIFKSSQNIVDTYNNYKNDDDNMNNVKGILKTYTNGLIWLEFEAGGAESFRAAIKKYVVSRQPRAGKTMEELEEFDIEAENSADNIIHNQCLFGVNDQSFPIQTVGRQNFRKQ